ncbi:RagB/SusD family nutrient uptake outer membrane protein [Hyalangium rubrum]|uniref:RagB/SusD family nutrient uptake outer membrane protein n=1 Tax=Hyalangium rubrum TaxID=3103134 RepID=A0ABU5H0F0_9BACT|nr:RagB/SusD family nutrient uptake outer membrane protein [Hyalangium sp. s54d21]MDY7226257.1 RagB/SusD family nutrient uptake outer membrane protein [Hyalangium sp. s54d21]
MKKTFIAALCASSVGLGACGLDIPDLNNPSLESLQQTPTRSSVTAAAHGLLIGNRDNKSDHNGYVAHLGLLGRESYTFDTTDPRFGNEMLTGTLNPGNAAFGGNFWTGPYANIRNANTLMEALDKVPADDLNDAQKEAIRGFAKTIQAHEFLTIVSARDTNGGPIDVSGDPRTLAPIVSKDEMLTRVVSLLDEAKGHLDASVAAENDAFPFTLGSGYAGFEKPSTYVKFNRALKARAQVYLKDWTGTLTSLGESFLDTNRELTLGTYYSFGTGSGDTINGLTNTAIYAHPSIVRDAERKPDCVDVGAEPFRCLDARVGRKIAQVAQGTYQNLSSTYGFTMYEQPTAPLPIIRNEELVLLRAEANINIGTEAALTAAEEDLNRIRVINGLEPVLLTTENAVDVLLKERRYSLLFEGGHRWIDMRRYNRLNQLPKDRTNDVVHERFPIPVLETDARQ